MAYFRECPLCGAHLDPGESCDCAKEKPLETSGGKEKQYETKGTKEARTVRGNLHPVRV